jgi:hypothetical protein
MPTMYRQDTRTWKYNPYSNSDAVTREAFRHKAGLLGRRVDPPTTRYRCAACAGEWSVNELGATFGDAAVGTPLCPGDECTSIGWDYFTELEAPTQ